MSLEEDFALLGLQVEWGADEALLPDPLDRLRTPEAASRAPAQPAPVLGPVASLSPRTADAPQGTPGERALAAAAGASTLDELRAAMAAFDGCHLRDTAAHLVFAEGNPESPVLLIGDPPGREEDRSGHPFAGAEGQLLDQMLASIRLTRDQIMATPLVPWRPPGGRPVNQGEMALLLPFLHRLIALLEPDFVIIFGNIAARAVLQQPATRKKSTLDWFEFRIPGMQKTINALALPSLADIVKTPPLKRDAWVVLRRLRRALDLKQSDK